MEDFDILERNYMDEMKTWLRKTGSKKIDFFSERKFKLLLEKLNAFHLNIDNVVEVGCGIGLLAEMLARKFENVCGIDSSLNMIDQAKRINKNSKVKFLCADAKELPFEDSRVDMVLCANLLHHIDNGSRIKALLECKRILKDKGILVIFEHNPLNPLTQLIVRTTRIDKGAKLISLSRLMNLVRGSRFRIIDFFYNPFFPERLQLLQRFEKFLEKFPLGFQYCLFAEKI